MLENQNISPWRKAFPDFAAKIDFLFSLITPNYLLYIGIGVIILGLIICAVALVWKYSTPPSSPTSETSATKPWKNSLEDLYVKGFPTLLSTEVKLQGVVKRPEVNLDAAFEIRFRLYQDFVSHTDFVSIFVPRFKDARLIDALPNILNGLSDQIKIKRDELRSSVGVGTESPGTAYIDAKDLSFSGRAFLYTDNFLNPEQIGDLVKLYKSKGMFLEIRGMDFWQFHKDDP